MCKAVNMLITDEKTNNNSSLNSYDILNEDKTRIYFLTVLKMYSSIEINYACNIFYNETKLTSATCSTVTLSIIFMREAVDAYLPVRAI